MTNVRLAAARVLLALERGGTTLSDEVETARAGLLDPRDRALLLELASGVLRWRAELDAVIAMASGRSVKEIDSRALAVLRLAVYQLRHLERIPPHAILHESVEAVRALRAPRAAGFVNAVLRAIQRRGRTLKLPARPPDDGPREKQERYLAMTWSHPLWLVRRWLDRYGFENTRRWCEFNNSPPEITVRSAGRLSPEELQRALAAEGVAATPSERVAGAWRLAPGELGRLSRGLADELRVQDEGAQLVAAFAGAAPGEMVADLCAAPGGKALIVGEQIGLTRDGSRQHGARLVAGDYRAGRVDVLAGAVRASRLPIDLIRLDARQPLPFRPVFDLVLLDVPCSGLGTIRRDPDVKWRRQPEELPTLASEAAGMLQQAARIVRPGGRLLYATCSSEPEENEQVVNRFLQLTPEFEPKAPAFTTTPFADGLDAFFGALLVRTRAA